jgi:hypothetical protein
VIFIRPTSFAHAGSAGFGIMSGDTVVGSLKKATGGTVGDRWAWSITCVLIDPGESPRIGWAPTREEAQQQFAKAWRAWLVRTELKEK